MFGTYRPYLICVRDHIDLTNFIWTLEPAEQADVESRMKPYFPLYEAREEPEFLESARSQFGAVFESVLGRKLTAFRPVGAAEMHRRCLAIGLTPRKTIFHVPSEDEDVILCASGPFEATRHYRDSTSLRILRQYFMTDAHLARMEAGWSKVHVSIYLQNGPHQC